MKIKVDVSDGKNIFFISDFHLFHKNVIKFDNRPFITKDGLPDLPNMHKTLIKNWNSVVDDNDIVFYLGDLCFGRKEWANEIIFGLKGTIHYIIGNHDEYNDIVNYKRFESVSDLIDLKIHDNKVANDVHMVLCHYPIYSWNRGHHGSYHIHGHSHMSLSKDEFHKTRRIYDVGCNGWDYTPVSYKKILELGEKIEFKITTNHH
jgi:calcineurin-like phosphoesterase family protein